MCDLTVTPTGYSKQNKMTTSIRDLSPKEGLQGANFKWSPFSLLLLIAKYNLPLDPHHLDISKGLGRPAPPHFGQGKLIGY